MSDGVLTLLQRLTDKLDRRKFKLVQPEHDIGDVSCPRHIRGMTIALAVTARIEREHTMRDRCRELHADVGTVVLLGDGRVGAVSHFTRMGDDDRIVSPDGHEERSDAWQIAEMLTEEPDAPADPVWALAEYLSRA